MTTIEKEAQQFLSSNKELGAYQGTYVHKTHGILINVLRSTSKYVTIKWGETEVVRSVSYMIDFEKFVKSLIH